MMLWASLGMALSEDPSPLRGMLGDMVCVCGGWGWIFLASINYGEDL